MNWVALFSQTGSEIANLSKIIGCKPDLILTNNITQDKYEYHPDVSPHVRFKHDFLMEYLRGVRSDDTIITLHGYLRIIPPDVCDKFEMYNGHPGLITMYPQLKGKDPQERITPEMTHVGSVVHKVTAGVDEGEIVSVVSTENTGGDYYNVLRQTSLEAWKKVLLILTERENGTKR